MLQRGISRATINEAPTAYLETAAVKVQRQGLADRVSLVYGNIVTMTAQVPAADIVTLDKVVYCYDGMPGLVQASLAKARKLYDLVYPHDNWLVRTALSFDNIKSRLKGSNFPVLVYPAKNVAA